MCPSVPKSVKINSLVRYKCISVPPLPLLLDTPLHTISWVFSEVRDSNKKLLEEVKHLHNSQLEGKMFLKQLASSLQLGNQNPASYKTLLYFSEKCRDGVLVHLQAVGTYCLSSAASSHLELGSTGRVPDLTEPQFGYLNPELPQGTEQMAARTAATTAPLLLVSK